MTTATRFPEPAGTRRIAALDVLRGVAILGTLGTNIWLFASPGGVQAWFETGFTTTGGAETWLMALANGKFLGLLTLLFGIGMELQYRSAVRHGLRWPGRYLLRSLVLLVEGFVHYVLVFEFDVLMGYAIASMLVAWLIGRSDRVVVAWAATVGALYALGIAGLTAILIALPDDDAAAPDPSRFPTASWPDQVLARLTEMGLYRIELILIVPSSVVLFLVGSRLLRAGLFADTESGARLRRRLAWLGLGAGVPLNALTTWAGPDWALVDRYLVPPLVSLGILALGTTLVARVRDRAPAHRPGFLRRGVESVGRTALSCYVLQNLLASWLCYEWGLGLAADSTWRTLALWAGIGAVLLVAAPLWLRHHSRGPIELVMHRLTAARPQGSMSS